VKKKHQSDFMFQLTQAEWDILRSQFVTANKNISFKQSYKATQENQNDWV